MNDDLDRKQTGQASSPMAMYTDGTADLGLGLLVLLLGLYPSARNLLGPAWTILIFLLGTGLVFIGLAQLRKRVTTSRLAQIPVTEPSRERQKVGLYLTIFLLILTLVTWLVVTTDYLGAIFTTTNSAWLQTGGVELVFTVIILGIFSALAYTLSMPRFYLYGMLLSASTLLQAMIGNYNGAQFLVSGVIMTAIGIYALTRFVKKYPQA